LEHNNSVADAALGENGRDFEVQSLAYSDDTLARGELGMVEESKLEESGLAFEKRYI